jgi:hypothetical protein
MLNGEEDWSMGQMVEHLPRKFKSLSLINSPGKGRRRRRGREKGRAEGGVREEESNKKCGNKINKIFFIKRTCSSPLKRSIVCSTE